MALAAACASLLAYGSAAAQSKSGTSIGAFLKIEPGARAAALGNAGVALDEGIQSVYYNPAALGRIGEISAGFTHSEWFAGIAFDYAGLAIPLGNFGTVFGSVTSLNSGDIDVRTVDQPLGTGERYDVSDLAIGLGYGRVITERFAAGAQLNYVEERIWHTTLRTVVLNIGTVFRISENGLRIGASISNYGTRARFSGRDLAIQYDQDPETHGDNSSLPGEQYADKFGVPIVFRFGGGMPFRVSRDATLLLALDALHPSDNTESVSSGAELTFREALSVRAGYQQLFQEDSEAGLTLGAGLRGALAEHGFQFDYAWADQGRLERTHRFTFEVAF